MQQQATRANLSRLVQGSLFVEIFQVFWYELLNEKSVIDLVVI